MTFFGVGVVGATGFIGTPYRAEIREATEDARIIAVCARRRDLLAAAALQDGVALATDDWRQVVAHPEVNLVLVATPDALHYDCVMACAEAGKHVVCEKPVGMNAVEAERMYRAYQQRGLGHFVPFWSRYLPVFQAAREVVRRGTLGDIRAIIYRWHNPRPAGMPFTWRDDAELSAAGSVADVGSHAYDTLRWLLGQEALRVLVHADTITPPKPDLGVMNLEEALRWGSEDHPDLTPQRRRGTAYDYASLAFVMQQGAVGMILLSHAPFLRRRLAPEIELHGTDASLAADRFSGQLMMARPGQDPQLLRTVPDPGFGNRFVKHVFPALRARMAGQPTEHPGLDDGWSVQCFTDACTRSASQGRWITVEGAIG